MIDGFTLDARLDNDCIVIAELKLSRLLLMNNALVPWFILVPRVDKAEVVDLTIEQQQTLQAETTQVSRYIQKYYPIDKLNTAAIGNIVEQLHIHIIGRTKTDYCWPNVVWGNPQKEFYDDKAIANIKTNWIKFQRAS